ncbi:kelch repeat-containing protein [Kwoniella heveanensis CBS 569]|nr:kelch repeat-containing protein [Kwoniella heveanensis CBS 569]
MDSNGRHRNASGSNLTLPSSSTLRKLPSLARSPFRRSEKTSTPPPADTQSQGQAQAQAQTQTQYFSQTATADPVTHHRGSTFPSLSQVVVDDSSVSSAFFASTSNNLSGITVTNTDGDSQRVLGGSEIGDSTGGSSSTSGLLPPSRSSSLLPTPEIGFYVPGTPLSPFSNKRSQTSVPGPSSSPMIGTSSDQNYNPATDNSDLEPITYPAHLAQMKPDRPDRDRDPASSASSSSRTLLPRRDFSGPPVVLGAVHQAQSQPSSSGSAPGTGSGGPPFGVPKRKESMPNNESSINGNGPDTSNTIPSTPAESRLRSGGDTDSGTDETVVTRRRANTKTVSRGARERSLTVPSSVGDNGSSAANGAGTGASVSSERTRKISSKMSRAISVRLLEPTLPCSRNVQRAPASAMYFSPVPCHGRPPNQALRAHSGTLVGERIWLIGGVDKHSCWRGVAWFDTESLLWSTIETRGEQFPPLRAHTTTLVGDKLFIFGGGDGPSYSNEVWILDTTTHRFSRPVFGNAKMPLPPPRRAHTTVLYRHYLVVFGGGNGQAALNDVWALDVSDLDNLTWTEWKTKGDVPQKKGYHTANLVGDKMIVFGGSDGHASFADIHVLNLHTRVWTLVTTDVKHNRLSHTSTQVGSYLFILGGHNGQTYAQDVLLFNLVTLQWETKIPKGVAPPGRGYHVALLHDARIFISGGYNGESVFDDLWTLDLSAGAYLPQVTTFEVDETARID